MKFNVGMNKIKKVINSCETVSQIMVAEKYCNMYIVRYFPYPNDHFEVLCNNVRLLAKARNIKIIKKLNRKEKRNG